MDKILELSEELKASLYEKEEFKEYFRLKELYENNQEIKSLLILMKETPKSSKEFEKISKEYNSHPLVINYMNALEEVKAILKIVGDILNK